jgi:hypothetical protein
MSRPLRSETFRADEVCIVHAVQRCVRRAFLAGKDPVTGRDFEFRREWIRRRLELLASVYGIDVLGYAILSNHLHLVLRNRPDVVATWSDRQVAERWLMLFPGRRMEEYLGQPTEMEIQALERDRKRLEAIRLRLSDLSWFMRSLSEPIARMANRQDECTGRFWEGRFKAQRITDEAGLLACAMYVDLNPIRAAMALTLEQSRHTSAYDRLQALAGGQMESAAAQVVPLTLAQAAAAIQSTPAKQHRGDAARRRRGDKRPTRILRDAWLAPLTLQPRDSGGPLSSRSRWRASDKGFLEISVPDYLMLLEWTAGQRRKGTAGLESRFEASPKATGISATAQSPLSAKAAAKTPRARGIPGPIATVATPSGPPDRVRSILARLGIEGNMWCDLVWNFKRYFGRAIGSPASLRADAARRGRSWSRGQRAAAWCFNGG